MNSSSEKIKQSTSNAANRKKILDLFVDDLDYNILYPKICLAINSDQKIVINYANAYTFRLIKRNKALKKALLSADIIHSDGVGIWLGAKILNNAFLKYRFNFTDCSLKMLKDCQSNSWSLFLLGSTDKTLNAALNILKRKFSGIKVVGTCNGYDELKTKNIVSIINEKSPDILWVGLGSPRQELWIYENKEKLNCKVIQSVGDVITHIADKKTRGPSIIQKLGFEWLARLLRHPIKYFDRYIIGIPVFIYLIMKEYFVDEN